MSKYIINIHNFSLPKKKKKNSVKLPYPFLSTLDTQHIKILENQFNNVINMFQTFFCQIDINNKKIETFAARA